MIITSHRINSIQGTLDVPGDKSISHRVAILGGLAEGVTHVTNFLCSEDCINTLRAMEQLGARVEVVRQREGYGPTEFKLHGINMQPHSPVKPIDCGNSGTGMRLMAGMLAACPFDSTMFGDVSLSSRPMGRIMVPLAEMGARIDAVGEKPGCAPLNIHGGIVRPINYTLPMASAQVKSAVLLAGMFASGRTTVTQPAITRDHTERLFHHFSIPCQVSQNGLIISTDGPAHPKAADITIPSDISSASFWIVAASILPGSNLTLKHVGINPTRNAVIKVLQRMGSNITISNIRGKDGEPYGDITIQAPSQLNGTELFDHEIPNLIDEIPIIAVAASVASTPTTIRNAKELRVKEADRIAIPVHHLRAMGASVDELEDGMIIHGNASLRGCELESHHDHRIAMSFLIAGLAAEGTTTLHNCACINTSYPGFTEDLHKVLQN